MDIEALYTTGCLENVFACLPLRDLIALEQVCRLLRQAINTERVLRDAARRWFANKKYVLRLCLRLITAGNDRDGRRVDLEAMTVRQLKGLITQNGCAIDKNVLEKVVIGRILEICAFSDALPIPE